MQPKNLREKWGMKHFWKCISPKTVLLHILCPSQYATKSLSHQGSPARHEQTRTKIWKVNAESKAIFYGKVQLLQRCSCFIPQPVLLFQVCVFKHLQNGWNEMSISLKNWEGLKSLWNVHLFCLLLLMNWSLTYLIESQTHTDQLRQEDTSEDCLL